MEKKIRRLKITVHTKEMVVVRHGSDHTTHDTEFVVCPVCNTPVKALPTADQKDVSGVKTLTTKND